MHIIKNFIELSNFYDKIKDNDSVAIDIETNDLCQFYNDILLISVKTKDIHLVLDVFKIGNIHIRDFLLYIQSKDCVIIAHNAKFELLNFGWHYNIIFEKVFCTLVVAQIIYNGKTAVRYGLYDITKLLLDKEIDKTQQTSFVGMPFGNDFSLLQYTYSGMDVINLLDLSNILYHKGKLLQLKYTILLELSFLPHMVRMELEGLTINKLKWLELTRKEIDAKDKLIQQLDNKLLFLEHKYNILTFPKELVPIEPQQLQYNIFEDIESNKAKMILKNINYNSNYHILKILLRMGIKINNTSFETLEDLLMDYSDYTDLTSFLEILLQYREVQKKTSTYGESFISKTNKVTNKLHTSFSQVFTITGRLSSSSYKTIFKGLKFTDVQREGVNLQNIPADKKYRACFEAEPGYVIITADYKGQEIALAASQSQDPILLKAVKEGLDIHSYLAQESFRIIKNDPTFVVSAHKNAHLRTKHKSVLFAVFYGGGPARISTILNIDKELGTKVYLNITKLLPGLIKYQNKIHKEIKHNVIRDNSFTNRLRYFDDYKYDKISLGKAQKEASNFGMQSSGASMIKLAITNIGNTIIKKKLNLKILSTVHDEIIFQCKRSEKYKMAKIIKNIMEDTALKFLCNGISITVTPIIKNHWSK